MNQEPVSSQQISSEKPDSADSLAVIKKALWRGRDDSTLLDGRDFDPDFWDAADAAFAALVERLEQADRAICDYVAQPENDLFFDRLVALVAIPREEPSGDC